MLIKTSIPSSLVPTSSRQHQCCRRRYQLVTKKVVACRRKSLPLKRKHPNRRGGLPKANCRHLRAKAKVAKPSYQTLEETNLTECLKCNRVATYQNLCYFHWQERTSKDYFLPEAYAARAAYNLALA